MTNFLRKCKVLRINPRISFQSLFTNNTFVIRSFLILITELKAFSVPNIVIAVNCLKSSWPKKHVKI